MRTSMTTCISRSRGLFLGILWQEIWKENLKCGITYDFLSPNFHQSDSYHLWPLPRCSNLQIIENAIINYIQIPYANAHFLTNSSISKVSSWTNTSEKTSPDFIQPIYVRGTCKWASSVVTRASVQEKEREKKLSNKETLGFKIQSNWGGEKGFLFSKLLWSDGSAI